jgi:hypothetical protein
VLAATTPGVLDVIPTGPGAVQRVERTGLRLGVSRWLPDNRHALALARVSVSAPARLYVIDIDGRDVVPVTPEGFVVGATGWRASPDGRTLAVSTPSGPQLFPIAGGAAVPVPNAAPQWQVIGWIDRGLLVTDDALTGGNISLVNPATGAHELWAHVAPRDPVGLMFLDLTNFAATPDGRSFGYTWHRATSDLFLVNGWE